MSPVALIFGSPVRRMLDECSSWSLNMTDSRSQTSIDWSTNRRAHSTVTFRQCSTLDIWSGMGIDTPRVSGSRRWETRSRNAFSTTTASEQRSKIWRRRPAKERISRFSNTDDSCLHTGPLGAPRPQRERCELQDGLPPPEYGRGEGHSGGDGQRTSRTSA